jgi:hypothetical protein
MIIAKTNSHCSCAKNYVRCLYRALFRERKGEALVCKCYRLTKSYGSAYFKMRYKLTTFARLYEMIYIVLK